MTEDQQHRRDLIAALPLVLLTMAVPTSVIAAQNTNQPEQAASINQEAPAEKVTTPTQQAPTQHNQNNYTEPPNYITFIMWFTGAIITIFTALVAGFGIFTAVFTLRHKKEADETLAKMEKQLERATGITSKIEEQYWTSEKVKVNPKAARKALAAAASSKGKQGVVDKAIARAIEYQTNNNDEDAIEQWLAIARLTENDDKEKAARAYFSAAYLIDEDNDKYKEKDEATVNKVLDLYGKSIELHPTASAYTNRGNAKNDLGKYAEAIADYNEAIRLKPNFAEAYNNRGNAKSEIGKHEEALADCTEAIRISPDFAEAYNNRGSYYREMGEYDAAMRDANKSIELKETAHAYHTRAEIYRGQKELDSAIINFSKAIELDNNFIAAYLDRGKTCQTTGNNEEALADFKKVLELEPRNEEDKKAIAAAKQAIAVIEAMGKND